MADRKVAVVNHGAWAASHAYVLEDTVTNDTLKTYRCITAGTSAGSGGPTGTGTDITDGGAHWKYEDTVAAAYPSLSAALSGEDDGDLADLTTSYNGDGNGGILTIDCYNFEDTTAPDMGTGYTVSSSYYINIVAHDSHGGKWSTSAYRLSPTTAAAVLTSQERYTRVTGIQFDAKGSGNYGSNGFAFYADYQLLDKCIVRGTNADRPNGSDYNAIYPGGSYSLTAYNVLAYDFIDTANTGFKAGYGQCTFYNCTAVNCNLGFDTGSSDTTIKNCLSVDCGNGFSGTFNAASNYNASDIASDAPGANSVNLSAYADTDIFFDPAKDDFHLKSSSPCIGVGTDLSGTFTVDIDGETRTGTWDIGADEYVAAGDVFIYIPFRRFNYIARLCFAAISLTGGLIYALR
jgi:hypothetical protein